MSQPFDVTPIGLTRFRTAGLTAAQRIAGWDQVHAAGLVGVRTRTPDQRPLEAAALKLTLPNVTLARIRGSAHSVERSEHQIVEHPTESAVLYIGLAGPGQFTTRNGRDDVLPGHGLICDADQVFTRSFTHGLDALLLTVPRRALRAGHCAPSSARSHRFAFGIAADEEHAQEGIDSAALRSGNELVRRMAAALQDAVKGAPTDLDALEDDIIGLVGRLITDGTERSDHADAALAFIAEHADDRALSAERVASAVGLSQRQLSRVLSRAGTSVPRAIRDRRLLRAQRMLADPLGGSRSMREIAEAVGFSSPEQFSRSYHQRFGISPLRHRRTLIDD